MSSARRAAPGQNWPRRTRENRRDDERVYNNRHYEKEDREGGRPEWAKHRDTMRAKFPEGWAPPKRLSREAMRLLRVLHRAEPDVYTTPALASRFKISPEAVRRILRSKFELPDSEALKRDEKRKARLRAAKGEEEQIRQLELDE